MSVMDTLKNTVLYFYLTTYLAVIIAAFVSVIRSFFVKDPSE